MVWISATSECPSLCLLDTSYVQPVKSVKVYNFREGCFKKLTVKATRLSTGSTGLDSELLTPLLESRQTLLGVAGQVNHDGGPHAGTKVGGAGVDVAVLLGEGKVLAALSLDRVSDSLDATGKTGEDSLDVAALLHGDDPHLVLLVHPQQEGLGLVVEDSTALWPVALHAGSLEGNCQLLNRFFSDYSR